MADAEGRDRERQGGQPIEEGPYGLEWPVRRERGWGRFELLFRALERSAPVQILKDSHENTGHHGGGDEPNVYAHTMRVYDSSVRTQSGELDIFPQGISEDLRGRLNKALGDFLETPMALADPKGESWITWRDMQLALALVHDIGKVPPLPFKDGSDSLTSTKGHEVKGAILMDEVWNSPSFTEIEGLIGSFAFSQAAERLTELVKHHGDISEPIISTVKNGILLSEEIIETSEQAFQSKGFYRDREFLARKIAVILNVIADFESGRREGDRKGIEMFEESFATGFTPAEKQAARVLLAHYLSLWGHIDNATANS